MAIVTFTSNDPVPEIHAVIAVLNLWLRELPSQLPRPASGKFIYGPDGAVRLEVNVQPEDEPPVEEPK